MNKITSFDGQYRFLSNFWPVVVTLDGWIYPTVEHAYQAAKTLDLEERRMILEQDTPGKAKRAGKKLTIRHDWNEVKIEVMTRLVQAKFLNPELRDMLVNTGTVFIEEGNTWGDCFWGTCNGEGENHLGKILMRTRELLTF